MSVRDESGSGSWVGATWARPSSGASTKTGLMPDGHLMMADVTGPIGGAEEAHGVVIVPDNVTLVRRSDVIILAVKPQTLAACWPRNRSRHARKASDLGGRRRVHDRGSGGTSTRHPDDSRHAEARRRSLLEGATAIANAAGLDDAATWTPRARSSKPSDAW